MNILLFADHEIQNQQGEQVNIKIKGARSEHLSKTRGYVCGDSLRIGLIDGLCGVGTISKLKSDTVWIDGILNQAPPQPANCKLILALPRPKMLRRMLVDIAMLGIKDVVLINSFHVQKSYWSSPLLRQENIQHYFLKGLEQSCDTRMPDLSQAPQFKSFVEDQLLYFAQNECSPSEIILADPRATQICPQPATGHFTLIVGPENGFTEYEIKHFVQAGANGYTLGARHLRVETATNYLLGRLLK